MRNSWPDAVSAAPECKRARLPVCEQPPNILLPQESARSWRSNFAWALSGNVVYAACQWGMVVALAKLGSSFMVGQFSLGLAIATPVLMFASLQLRAVQATDARRQYSFRQYLGLRLVTTLIGLTVIAAITGAGNYQRGTAMVILAVALIKGVETLSDIFYGLFQLNDRLDQIGKSMMFRGVISVIVLSVGLYFTRNVVASIALLAMAWLAVLLGFDARRGRCFASVAPGRGEGSEPHRNWRRVWPTFSLPRQWKLVRLSLPLGFVMTLVSLNLSLPRLFVHASLGEHQLGIFSAMAYTTVAVATFADALGHSMIPRMARFYAGGNLAAFRSSLAKLVAIGAVFGLAGFATAQVFGGPLLRVLFTAEYAAHAGVFLWLVAAAGISCIASLLHYGITSARCFAIQVPMFVLVAGSNALACSWLVPSSGLRGAALSMIIAACVHLIVAATILLYLICSPAKHPAGREGSEICFENWEPGL
jgi:O-antigen/teichoic acid export membrane protein